MLQQRVAIKFILYRKVIKITEVGIKLPPRLVDLLTWQNQKQHKHHKQQQHTQWEYAALKPSDGNISHCNVADWNECVRLLQQKRMYVSVHKSAPRWAQQRFVALQHQREFHVRASKLLLSVGICVFACMCDCAYAISAIIIASTANRCYIVIVVVFSEI